MVQFRPNRSLLIALCGWLAAASALATPGGWRQRFDPSVRVALPGNTPRRALPEFDRGPADGNSPMQRMILLLNRRPGAGESIDRFLADRHDPASPNYHRWLTPDEFGQKFGISDADLADVVGWLKDQGFTIDEVANGRGWINFTGTVAGVERAFGTSIHRFEVDGEIHQANVADPSLPRGLDALVTGVVSLHDFRKMPMHRVRGVAPEGNRGFNHFLAPGDFAKIYNTSPLIAAGTDGSGESIAIVQRTEISIDDARTFRSFFGLPAKDPVTVLNGPSPGDVGGNDEVEADLDVEWAGGVAPAATVKLVVSASTATTDGVDLSAQYIVDHNVSPIASTSFGLCEDFLGLTENIFLNNLWAQAAAEGITSFVSSGDDGANDCADGAGLSVNGEASTPYNVAVGGTAFNDTPTSQYWSTTADPATSTSALGYIPEDAWNDSLGSTGGGVSLVYSKPSWQSGPGVPDDGHRDVPDVSLSAAVTHVSYAVYNAGSLIFVGGTSASTPAMGGILALVDQKKGRQGNANFVFSDLARNQYGASGPAVFHDVSSGNNDDHGVTGFSCGPGYDEVTGWGSVDAAALLANWPSALSAADFSLSVSPADLALTPGASGSMSLSLNSWGGFSSSVALALSGIPAGISATLDSNELTSNAPVTLTVTAGPAAQKGLFPVTVTAVGGGQAHAVTLVLLVRDLQASTLKEYAISTPQSFVQGLTVGPDGALWFAEFDGNAIGRMSTSGAVTEFPVPTDFAQPNEIVSAPDGALWFTEFGAGKLGRITTSGSITEFPIPFAGSQPYGVVVGPDAALWYTDAGTNSIGRMTTSGAATQFPVPTDNASPNFIVSGPDGALWFTEFFGNAIGRITTSGSVSEFSIPTRASLPQGITRGPNNDLWFVESSGNKVGRLTTGGQFTEYPIPFSGSEPNGIILGPDAALWFTEEQGSQIGRVTTSGKVTEYALAAADTFPYDIVVGPDGALWFSETDTNRIGRLALTAGGSMQLQGAAYSVAENGGSVSMLVTRTGGISGSVTVKYATRDGTAVAGRDYTASSGTLTFASGETSKVITVPIIDNLTPNANRAFTVNLSSAGGGATLGTPASAAVTIVDNEIGEPPLASFSFSPGNPTSATSVSFTDTSTGSPTSWSWNFGNPTSGASNTSTLQNPSHTFSHAGTFTVLLTATNEFGSSTPFTTSATVGSPPTASFTFSPGNPTSATSVSFTDTSTGSPTSWSWNFGNPTSGASNTSTLQNPSHTFLADGDYTVSLTASNFFGSSVPRPVKVHVVGPGILSWSRADSTVGANVGSVTVTLTRTGGTAGAVTVDYATSDGTAAAGEDYVASSGTLDFADGETSKAVAISILDVSALGPTKVFFVTLSNPAGGAALGDLATEGVYILNELGSPRQGVPVGGLDPPAPAPVGGRG